MAVAQLVESQIVILVVVGSSPISHPTSYPPGCLFSFTVFKPYSHCQIDSAVGFFWAIFGLHTMVMNEFAVLKPLITTLIMPPAAPLLLAFAGLWLMRRRAALGLWTVMLALLSLWLLSCHAVAVWLAATVLPQTTPLTVPNLKASGAQTIVVLGGGIHADAPEYGGPQLAPSALGRLRYGVHLARQTGLPLAFSGGEGWAQSAQFAPESHIAAETSLQDFGLRMRWVEGQSRDTEQNAQMTAQLLKPGQPGGVRRIALVTDAWHMPRSTLYFQRAGFEVVQAPTGFVRPVYDTLLEWLPSAYGLTQSRHVLRDWVGLQMARIKGG